MAKFLEGIFVLIAAYLVLANSEGFAKVAGATFSGGARLVEVLQARNSNPT